MSVPTRRPFTLSTILDVSLSPVNILIRARRRSHALYSLAIGPMAGLQRVGM